MSASIRQQAIVSVLSKHSKPAAGNEPGPFPWEATWARYTFTDDDLKKRVPSSVFKAYKKATTTFQALDPAVADVVAAALKDWAVERGCTHFCHWFQPIHIATAEKHECFIDLDHASQRAIMKLTGAELIRGEPDASSFPNGGIRDTSQARGYTVWDPSSLPWIRVGTNGATLMIPCSFISWTGDALDTKTPLLRASSALSREATRLLRLLGDDRVEAVQSTMGAEQEFFIVDRALYQARPDLVFCGRALFGAKPPKGQEMEDHYFAAMPPRILAYIEEVEHELWKLGIPARTRHNEVAPGQHEMAPIFEFSNLAADHNMVSMDIMKEVALRHGLVCLLHEKPFAGVNGSGKHNNWSMCTNYGLNLLEPTATPKDNLFFQVFLLSTIRAVDQHADLLRASIAVPGNDWRLGANEAPPAIMSVYLGSVLADLVGWIANGCPSDAIGTPGRQGGGMSSTLKLGERLQSFNRDRTDRNRTSPFAFTGNKFEFRAVGSSQSVGSITTILNTIAADSIRTFANDLEAARKADPNASVRDLAQKLMCEIANKHKRILFDGNGYSKEWVEEATRRGLPNMRECVSALEPFNSKKNLELFKSLEVLSYEETNARRNIYFEYYSKTINIEAQVSVNVATTQLIPAAVAHQKNQALTVKALREAGLPDESFAAQKAELEKVTTHVTSLIKSVETLKKAIEQSHHHHSDVHQHAIFMRDQVKPAIAAVREHADYLETHVEDNLWPLPKYSDLLFLK